jgi:hypothetical protein
MNNVIETIRVKNGPGIDVNPNDSLGVARKETKADENNNQIEKPPIKTLEEEMIEDRQFPEY